MNGASEADSREAVSVVMETLLHVGLLVHPSKIKWPAQGQRFCGFIYNIIETPRVEIPADKQDNDLALLHYLETALTRLSCLSMSVVVGQLQSLVPATPGNVGATLLCSLYDMLHADDGSGMLPTHPAYYYQKATLTIAVMEDIA
eukprot:7167567-Ditylum_brightwellii.AAC.2